MNPLCVIPARGGSKRIPRKNIKEFCGKPIIAYSIEAAIESEVFEEVMVSTDDKEIAEIAKQYGANVPFFRSKQNSDDFAGLAEVLIEVVEKYFNIGKKIDLICCILPTAPFVSKNILCEAYKKIRNERVDCIFPIVEFNYPIQRSLIVENELVKMNWPENFPKRKQDLRKTYHDAGQFYFIEKEALFKEKRLFTTRSSALILNSLSAQDIDTEDDWKIAEIKYKLLFKR